jgi:signal transduction histidine kinase
LSVQKLDKDKRLVLILAPRGRDAAVIEQVLSPLETRVAQCANLAELTRNLGDEATTAIVTEESLDDDGMPSLQAWIDGQPPWSDFPFVVLAARRSRHRPADAANALAGLGNDVLLERPLNAETLLKAVSSAMRSRRRQYEARAQLEQYEAIGRENHRLYEAERQARAEAEAANRAKDEFLATLSHELRTPLSAILGWTYVLQQRRSDLGDLARGVDTIQRNANSQARLIEDLLDMSRIVAGKVVLDVQTVVPAMLIDQVVASLLPSAQARNIEMAADLDAAVTPIAGDPQRLLQVFRTLLANALKFTADGGWVKVATSVDDGCLVVTVNDNGAGIAADFLPHVFERFRQADGSTTRSQGGLGLGLAIVRHLVELNGGSVSAFSEGLGRGARFEVRLPAAPEQRPVDEAFPESPRTSAAGSERTTIRGTRILLVEDDHDGREMVERLLRHHGGEVQAVDSAGRALQLLQDGRFDILISDIGMPQVDGYELLRRIRAAGNEIAAVALTAFARPEDKIKALEAGYAAHLSKPVEPPALIDAVATLARHRER